MNALPRSRFDATLPLLAALSCVVSSPPAASALTSSPAVHVPASPAQEVVDLPDEDRLLSFKTEELFSVGGFEATGWDAFGDVEGVAFDDSGNLYIFDGQVARMFVLDRDGRLVREFGRQGEGPGELRGPQDFAVTPDGRTVIHDAAHGAFLIFAPDGSFERQVSTGGGHPDFESLADVGSFSLSMISVGRFRALGEGDEVVAFSGRKVTRWNVSGQDAESAVVLEGREPPPPPERELSELPSGIVIRGTVRSTRAFTPRMYAASFPDGRIAYSDSSDYEVRLAGPDGETWRVFRRAITPETVTEEVMAGERERRERGEEAPRIRTSGIGTVGATRSALSEVVQQLSTDTENLLFWPEIPVLRGIHTSWEGLIWIRRRGDEPHEVDGPVDIVHPDDGYVGSLEGGTQLPDAFGPDGLAAYVEMDEYDVQRVVVRRLPEAVR